MFINTEILIGVDLNFVNCSSCTSTASFQSNNTPVQAARVYFVPFSLISLELLVCDDNYAILLFLSNNPKLQIAALFPV